MYEEMLHDLHAVCLNTGINIITHDDICVNKHMFADLNAIVFMNCPIKNDVLFHNGPHLGNEDIKTTMYKYKVDIKWIDDKNCYVYPCEDYFLTNPDYRLVYSNYNTMTLDLKKVCTRKPVSVWSLNDFNFFTTARKYWFNENKDALLMISIDENYDIDEVDINEFKNKYKLEMKYIDPFQACFYNKG